jgi:YegS/Rv2252/BmrU family lipid kinase
LNNPSSAYVIVNPNAGRKKARRDWPATDTLLRGAGIAFTHVFTSGVSDATGLARAAVEAGHRHIITVGGDGTFNEVANGILLQKIVPPQEVLMSMIPVGTGNDWCRMYGIPSDIPAAVEVIRGGHFVLQDAGRVAYTAGNARAERFFINIAGMGMDARVVFDTNRRKEQGNAGKVAYLMSLISATFSYKALPVKISLDDADIFNGLLYSANVGICKFSGGGMQQVPFAVPDDGLFDVTIIRKVSKVKVMVNMRKLYDGSFVKMKEVSTHRASRVLLQSDAPVLLEADGESLGNPPFEFSILPRALRISKGNQ